MIRSPTSATITGISMPNTPNESSTSRRPSRAPVSPQRFSTSLPSSSRSSAGFCRMLWSTSQLTNEKRTDATANSPAKRSSKPPIQRMLSPLVRSAVGLRPKAGDVLFVLFLDAMSSNA